MKKFIGLFSFAVIALTISQSCFADDVQGPHSAPQPLLGNAMGQPANGPGHPIPRQLGRPLFLKPSQTLQDTSNLDDADAPTDQDGNSQNYDLDNAPPSADFMASLNSPGFTRQIARYNRREAETDRYYWHNYLHHRFSHYTDDQGNHWYGGPSDEANRKWVMLLWRSGRFWWHDTDNDRWLYYYRNNWWSPDAQDPSLVDVYLYGRYYPCDKSGLVRMPPGGRDHWREGRDGDGNDGDQPDHRRHHRGDEGDNQQGDWTQPDGRDGDHRDDQDHRWNRQDQNQNQNPLPNNPPGGGVNGGPRDLGESQYTDPAKTRLIKVSGPNRDAYLFDLTPAHTLDHVYLLSNVADVQLSNDATGKVWMITFVLRDGSRKGYNADGHLTMP